MGSSGRPVRMIVVLVKIPPVGVVIRLVVVGLSGLLVTVVTKVGICRVVEGESRHVVVLDLRRVTVDTRVGIETLCVVVVVHRRVVEDGLRVTVVMSGREVVVLIGIVVTLVVSQPVVVVGGWRRVVVT